MAYPVRDVLLALATLFAERLRMGRAAAACGHPDANEVPPERLPEILAQVERGELTQIGERDNAWRIEAADGGILAWFYWIVSEPDGLKLEMNASEPFRAAYESALRDESGQTH